MKKLLKKLLATALAATMIFSMATTVFASDNSESKLQNLLSSTDAKIIDGSDIPEGIVPLEFGTYEEAEMYLKSLINYKNNDQHVYSDSSNLKARASRTQTSHLGAGVYIALSSDVKTNSDPKLNVYNSASGYVYVGLGLNASISKDSVSASSTIGGAWCVEASYSYLFTTYIKVGDTQISQSTPNSGSVFFYASRA